MSRFGRSWFLVWFFFWPLGGVVIPVLVAGKFLSFFFFFLFSRLKLFLMRVFFGLLKYTAKTRVKLFSIPTSSQNVINKEKCSATD